MKTLVTLSIAGLIFGPVALSQDKPMPRLVQTISIPNVKGRLDHMDVDASRVGVGSLQGLKTVLVRENPVRLQNQSRYGEPA